MGRLWIDADPSGLTWTGLDCDDDLAILMALALDGRHSHADGTDGTSRSTSRSRSDSRTRHKLEGISICGGNAPLKHTAANAQRLLGHVSSSSFDNNGSNVASRRLPSQPPLLPRGIGWRDMNVAWRSYRLFNRLSPDMESSDDAAHAILEAAAAAAPSAGDDNNKDDDKLTVLMLVH